MHNLTTTLNADTGTSISLPFTTHDNIYQVPLYYPQHLVISYSLCCGKRRLFAYISNGSGPHQKARPKILTDPRKKTTEALTIPTTPPNVSSCGILTFFQRGICLTFIFDLGIVFCDYCPFFVFLVPLPICRRVGTIRGKSIIVRGLDSPDPNDYSEAPIFRGRL